MSREPRDLTPVVDLTRERGTGPARSRIPVYRDLLPPCNHACPAGENIQGWLDEARAGRYRRAWEVLVRDNPLPSVHGRVCFHPCESHCNRQSLDAPVGIHAVERFLGDLAMEEGWPLPTDRPASGKRVLIVGAGPAGLSAAYHLARLGHAVEIRDAGSEPGGMMQFGIPAYRLPRGELQREIGRILAMGVKLVRNHRVDDLVAEREAGGFDAVFVAVGAQIGKRIDIPARDAARVLDAVSVLHQVGEGEAPRLGRRVVVYGGGDTAMDAARTARRLGADEAMVVYHRDRDHMPAHAFEADEAIAEGVKIRWLGSIREAVGRELTVEVMELDADGRPRSTGRLETLPADALILALGEQADTAFLRQVPGVAVAADGTVQVGEDFMTGCPGLFAAGDVTAGDRSVTRSVGQGKKAARYIDAWLHGRTYGPRQKAPVVSFAMLNLPVFSDVETIPESRLAPGRSVMDFSEVVGGLDETQARYESQRCLSCGNCFECDNCYAACPEQAIIKLGPGERYRVDESKCTGCGVCYEQCPVHAIEMVPDTPERN